VLVRGEKNRSMTVQHRRWRDQLICTFYGEH